MRSLTGVPFRVHGRDLGGLDCVGVVALVFGVEVRTGYRVRTGDLATIERGLRDAGFVAGIGAAGEVVVLRTGPGQLHLGMTTARGFVHADAGLRRVVESPWREDWAVLGFWRGAPNARPTPVGAPAPSPVPQAVGE